MNRQSVIALGIVAALGLPTFAQDAGRAPAKAITIHVSPDGAYIWNGEAVTQEKLRERIEAAFANNARPEIHLEPDSNAKYADVKAVMLLLAASGGGDKLGIIGGTQ